MLPAERTIDSLLNVEIDVLGKKHKSVHVMVSNAIDSQTMVNVLINNEATLNSPLSTRKGQLLQIEALSKNDNQATVTERIKGLQVVCEKGFFDLLTNDYLNELEPDDAV